jgi:hypothetical protein
MADIALEAPRRTKAGDQAVARHAPELDTGARVLLAAIDGKRGVSTLKARFGALLRVEQVLQTLASAGFVELPVPPMAPVAAAAPAPVVAASPATAAPAPGAAANVAPTLDLPDAKRMAVRGLTECLGPTGDVLALQIERCKTAEDFIRLHRLAQEAVRQQRGADGLGRFLQWSPSP